jgi:hypothetical protein
MAVENWNTNDTLNNTLEGVDVSEGCAPSGLNNMFRKMAAAIRVFYDKSYRKNETIKATAAGAGDPFVTHAEGDIWIEYTP